MAQSRVAMRMVLEDASRMNAAYSHKWRGRIGKVVLKRDVGIQVIPS